MTKPVLTPAERGRIAGLASARRLTPEQRRDRSRRAYLAGAVSSVIRQRAELTADQIEALRAAFTA